MRLEDHPLIKQALTHREMAKIERSKSNEMLEFLGDQVLELIITEVICSEYPDMNEGTATKVRVSVANTESIASLCRWYGFEKQLRLPRAAQQQALRDNPKVQADTLEAIIGAWYTIYGLDYVRQKIASRIKTSVRRAAGTGDWYDAKTELNDMAQKHGLTLRYKHGEASGVKKGSYWARVSVDGKVVGQATGDIPRRAEQKAAKAALKAVQRLIREVS